MLLLSSNQQRYNTAAHYPLLKLQNDYRLAKWCSWGHRPNPAESFSHMLQNGETYHIFFGNNRFDC